MAFSVISSYLIEPLKLSISVYFLRIGSKILIFLLLKKIRFFALDPQTDFDDALTSSSVIYEMSVLTYAEYVKVFHNAELLECKFLNTMIICFEVKN